MAHNAEINHITIIQNALGDYQGFTSGEKKYFTEHLSEWISQDKGFDTMIKKFSEKSLDAKPFLEHIGLLK